MKLHFKGKYNLDPNSLPHGEHMPDAVKFKEAESSKEMAIIGNGISLGLLFVFGFLAFWRCGNFFRSSQFLWGWLVSMVTFFPHEFLHAICFREDVYLYTNWKQGMLFVVGPEIMSRTRFVVMSLLPNVVFGFLPFVIGMIIQSDFFVVLGFCAISMGAGDYYNVYNAMTQMPKGAKTYLYQFNSYWFIPKK